MSICGDHKLGCKLLVEKTMSKLFSANCVRNSYWLVLLMIIFVAVKSFVLLKEIC